MSKAQCFLTTEGDLFHCPGTIYGELDAHRFLGFCRRRVAADFQVHDKLMAFWRLAALHFCDREGEVSNICVGIVEEEKAGRFFC